MRPRDIDPMTIYQSLVKARESGYRALRIWLCEGAEGILLDDGAISGLHPFLVESVAIIQEAASLGGLKLYWTLLDAHSSERTDDPVSRAILKEQDATSRFAELVAAPLAKRLDPRLTLAVEVVNQPEALITSNTSAAEEFAQWQSCGAAINTIGTAIRSEQTGALVTAGSTRRSLWKLWRSAPGLDAIDVHATGSLPLPSRSEIVRELALSPPWAESIPLIGGCLTSAPFPTRHSDYSAIFRWRLE
jgi:hypothetical protein